MIKIRRNVFETNSSSTHSVSICSKDEFDKWKAGELFWGRWEEKFFTKEELEEEYQKHQDTYDDLEDYMHYEGIYSYDNFMDMDDFETYEVKYTSKGGDDIVVFGYYGFDG